jgi:hypothetical protein
VIQGGLVLEQTEQGEAPSMTNTPQPFHGSIIKDERTAVKKIEHLNGWEGKD